MKRSEINKALIMILLIVTIIALTIGFSAFAIGRDFKILESDQIDNLIGFAALFFGIASIPIVKEYIGRISKGSRIYNKVLYIVMVLCIPFYLVWLIDFLRVPIGISNICGVIGIIISILTW